MRILSGVLSTVALTVIACGGSGSTAPVGQSPSLSITIGTNPIASGTSAQASATITDATGHTSPAASVTWSSSTPANASIDASGLVTGHLAGGAMIRATASGITGQLLVVVKAGVPASVTIFAGDAQSGSPGSQLNAPLCVLVKDAAGNVVADAIATYTIATGDGTMASPTAPSTNVSGVAISGLWTLGSVLGRQTVAATVPGAGFVTFIATAR